MPFIEVHHLEGRTEEQRQKLAQAITEAVAEIFKVQTDSVWVKFSEMPKSYFATGGGSEKQEMTSCVLFSGAKPYPGHKLPIFSKPKVI